MARPRPTPPVPPAPVDPRQYERPTDFVTQSTGPRDLARALSAGTGRTTGTRIVTPDPIGSGP